jgi:PAS domain S-box-containing protein
MRCIINDKTKRDRSEKEEADLHSSEERFRAITDTAADAIITINSRGIIQSWNQAATFIFGYDSDELIGHSINVIIPEHLVKSHEAGLSAAVA